MSAWIIEKSVLEGSISVPPSKSHSMRAILFSSLCRGQSTLSNILNSPDAEAMIQACKLLGAGFTTCPERIQVHGVSGTPRSPNDIIDAGNSGQVLRFAGAVAALTHGYAILTGDASIRSKRPVLPLLQGLRGLGAFAESINNGGAPIIIKGPLKSGKTELDGTDSQPVSALLIAASFLEGKTEIFVKNPGETPWIDLTLSWLSRIGVDYKQNGYEYYSVKGKKDYKSFDYQVPGDFSSAAFPIAAALLTDSKIEIQNLDPEDTQGDKKLIEILKEMGADLFFRETTLNIGSKTKLQGGEIDVNPIIDALPILAVLATHASSKTILRNGKIARLKESDRISCIAKELTKMGARIEELEDGLIIYPSDLMGAEVHSHDDHRIAMSLAVAGLMAEGRTIIHGTSCVKKSYPGFLQELKKINAKANEESYSHGI